MKLWTKIVEGIAGPAIDFFKERQKLKTEVKLKRLEGDIKIEIAKADRAIRELDSDTNWELEHIKNSGWKDEWVLILLSIPLVLVFVPYTAPFIFQGFGVLATTPEWYRWLIMLVFTAIYGIRIWRRK